MTITVLRSRKQGLWIFLFSLVLLSSCSTSRKVTRVAPDKNISVDQLFSRLKENELKFNTFTAKFDAEYENKKQTNSFGGTIRIRKDSLIWLSFSPVLGIEVFRMMVTQDSVKFINRMNNTYFVGDYEYVNKFLNTNIDFDILQSFLIGNDLSFYENGKFRITSDNELYKLSTAERTKLKKFVRNAQENIRILIQNIWIEPEHYKIIRADVKEIRKDNVKLEASYDAFENVDGQLFPKEMIFDISAENRLHVDVKFNKININTSLSFPFKIPADFREVK
ncbi:MAG: DUF4292 domain-containing protein [Syntrophothermus sp.]